MIKLKLYRHKYHKDIYLSRNWCLVGGGPDSDFYYATKDLMKAVQDANKAGFKSWMNSFLDADGNTMLKAKITDAKEIDIDGYKGVLQKELSFPVTEFEMVELKEG